MARMIDEDDNIASFTGQSMDGVRLVTCGVAYIFVRGRWVKEEEEEEDDSKDDLDHSGQ